MKFAFSTVCCPAWDFETVAARAKEYGYDGVELRGFLDETVLTQSNPFLTDPKKIRAVFEKAGIEIACLASSIATNGNTAKNEALAAQLRMYIDTAADIGCRIVKILDLGLRTGQSLQRSSVEMASWLAPLADYAAEKDIIIAVENSRSFVKARDMWLMLDVIGHPNVGAAWDLVNAAEAREGPLVSVPVLNSRIVYAQVKDVKFTPAGIEYHKLGEGEVPIKNFLTRLLGIGYKGYVALEWEKVWLPHLAGPEEILPDTIGKLRKWILPPEPPKPPKREPAAKAPVAAKPEAAKPTPVAKVEPVAKAEPATTA